MDQHHGPIRFSGFVLDAGEQRLLRGADVVPLRRRTLAVLEHLARRPGRLVTKAELLNAVWPDVTVSEMVLTVCVSELRKALDDDARTPRFVETVHGSGYRFVGAIDEGDALETPPATSQVILPIVGRDVELARLEGHLEQALAGRRQLVFVTGDAGIGKTTVVEAFLERTAARRAVAVARGQCVEQHGPGEAFMPVLEALGRLGREPGGEYLVPLLREHAPSWLLQLPGLLADAEREAFARQHAGVTRARMLREMVVGIEALTNRTPMVVVLEDLHWSDPSTFDLLAALAQRRGAARLLVIGTYRPLDVSGNAGSLDALATLLDGRHAGVELPLDPLSESATEEYLRARFGARPLPAGFARAVHQRTGGNPLFIVHLVSRAPRDEAAPVPDPATFLGDIPRSLRHAIEKQLGRLVPDEKAVLEAASVVGPEFTADEVAAALEDDVERVERSCESVVRRQSLLRALGTGEWPDGTVCARYAFTHAMYVEVMESGLAESDRRRLHQRIGERLETAYGARATEIAASLAAHFARAGDHARAFAYGRQAGAHAASRNAFTEATAHFRSALHALGRLPDSPERRLDELQVQVTLGGVLSQIEGFTAPDVGRAYARALDLSADVGDVPERFTAVAGLEAFYAMRGDLPVATSLARQLLALGDASGDGARRMEGHHAMGCNRLRVADLAASREHLERAIALYDLERPVDAHRLTGHDPKVCCLGHLACVEWLSGHSGTARAVAEATCGLAEELAHPPTLALALTLASWVHVLRREPQRVEELAERALAVSAEYGLVFFAAVASVQRGWALAVLGHGSPAADFLQQGLGGYCAIGAGTHEVGYRLLAVDGYRHLGRIEDAERELAAAFGAMERHGERHFEAELERLRGELIVWRDPRRADAAEPHVRKALAVARRQGARSLELRAALGLARLRGAECDELRDVYARFTEGFETADLADAAAILGAGRETPVAR